MISASLVKILQLHNLIVGSANEDKDTQYPLHNPKFNVDEEVIKTGAAAFSKIAYDYLNGKYKGI